MLTRRVVATPPSPEASSASVDMAGATRLIYVQLDLSKHLCAEGDYAATDGGCLYGSYLPRLTACW
jgi:hypothetical protein